jgi:monoterpene epsilon-lactone hydrolase
MGKVTWHVDARRMSWFTRVYVLGMWLNRDKEAFEGAVNTAETARRRQAAGDAAPTRWTRARCRVRTGTVAGMTVWTVSPRRRTPTARVVYVHGGGYVHPLTKDYWRLVRALAATPAEVIVPAYPLAPGATVDEVLPRLEDVVRTAGTPDLPTVLMGDSAGGALVLVIARRLARHVQPGERGVVRVVALCPWLDATLDDPRVANLESSDPMLAESGLRAAGRWWAGVRAPDDPVVSPVEGSLDGLPPVHVLIGDHDILRPAVDDLAERAARADVRLQVEETPAMFHVWMTRAIPEGWRTRRRLRRLVAESASET